MTRQALFHDIDRARNNPPPHVNDIARYDGDGISFTYWYQKQGQKREVCLKLIATNVDDYPDGNQFIMFTDDADVEPAITDTFVQLQAILDGSSVLTAIREISNGLHQALAIVQTRAPSNQYASVSDDGDDYVDDDESVEDSDNDYDDTNFGLDDLLHEKVEPYSSDERRKGMIDQDKSKMILDLRAVKQAGFRIGKHGDLSHTCILSISIRIARLKISDETMRAWDISRTSYLVLLIQFRKGYRNLSQIIDQSTLTGDVEIRIGLCNSYKPNKREAFSAFAQINPHIELSENSQKTLDAVVRTDIPQNDSFRPLFIGRPLNDLFRDRFLKIVKFRQQFGLYWAGAEKLFNTCQGTLNGEAYSNISGFDEDFEVISTRALSDCVTADALSRRTVPAASFPLVAMQFALRHFVRCTEFCLICQCQVQDTFEALKPYVCSKPLCLYQFLSLGFGPAVEWEIISQPYVVDLLISLCYLQTQHARIRELPLGLNLKVPLLQYFKSTEHHQPLLKHNQVPKSNENKANELKEPVPVFKACLHPKDKLLVPTSGSSIVGKEQTLKGEWLVLVSTSDQNKVMYNACVTGEQKRNLVLEPLIRFALVSGGQEVSDNKNEPDSILVDCYLYDEHFDDLPPHYQYHAILFLLRSIPSVSDMQEKLAAGKDYRDISSASLRSLAPKPALDLLRWIIASNRSCIMQVDATATKSESSEITKTFEERVSDMDEWMQFRFAQGAPDKEQRFVNCVRDYSPNKEYPTLFAWHGSPLYNWHSIIRQGLNFDETIHGRSYGHGVYMSSNIATSTQYSGTRWLPNGQTYEGWPNSELKISAIVSLQEVVNAPSSFVSAAPHFVVAKKDWIQTRYLFVKTDSAIPKQSTIRNVYRQDPTHCALGMQNQPIRIPIAAVSHSRRFNNCTKIDPDSRKRKLEDDGDIDADHMDDILSIASDDDDCDMLGLASELLTEQAFDWEDDIIMTDIDDMLASDANGKADNNESSKRPKKKRTFEDKFSFHPVKTDFQPATLDTTGISFLDPPKYASSAATKALMRAFNETIKVQEATPLHELGFYLDPNRIENMYQWIVELHSFEETLPLAKDMKSAGITSIVVEMRFTNDFPFSPPFVRIVKPRFIDPISGGGGHITQGGAICMELLTSTGWSAVNTMESVLLQVRLAMSERERPARLLQVRGQYQNTPYGVGEAIAAYKRFCQRHGWQAPKTFQQLESA